MRTIEPSTPPPAERPLSSGNRLYFLDALAGLLILRVITLHSLSNYLIVGTAGSPDMLLHGGWCRLIDSLLRFSVPGFVCISGIKFGLKLRRGGYPGYGVFARQRLDRILRPYLLFSGLYIITGELLHLLNHYLPWGFTGLHVDAPGTLLWMVLGPRNPGYQLWFLVMLLMINLLYPPWRETLSASSLRLVIAGVLYAYSCFHHLPYPLHYLRYMVFYDGGAILAPHLHQLQRTRNRWLAIAPVLVTLSGIALRVQATQRVILQAGDLLIESSLPFTLVAVCAAWGINRGPRPLIWLGGLAWPLYLLHEPFILSHLAQVLYSGFDFIHPLDVPVLAVATLICSTIGIFILKSNPVTRRLF
ncbi:acyltransferase [bacterium]|nr:acyltransferase [candidate division CSSED10-310 bacterium]